MHLHVLLAALRCKLTLSCLRLIHAHIIVTVRSPPLFLLNSLLRSYSVSSSTSSSLRIFRTILRSGLSPDHYSLPFALNSLVLVPYLHLGACTTGKLLLGRSLHSVSVKLGSDGDVYVATALLRMYFACKDATSSNAIFQHASNRNVVTWTAMVGGLVELGMYREALGLVKEMDENKLEINAITVVHALAACGRSSNLEMGRWVHERLRLWDTDDIERNVVVATALFGMYAQCGSVETARMLFDKMWCKNEVAWNAIIGVYSQSGNHDEVLHLFTVMRKEGFKPDEVTWLSILSACSGKAGIIYGQCVHGYMEKTNGNASIQVSTSLIDMYSKNGNPSSALQIFQRLPRRDVMVWTSMIGGLAAHGHGEDAVALFHQMQRDGVTPDRITYVAVLTACNHAGMVDQGLEYFETMKTAYGIKPTVKHYGCLVDMLSRSGRTAEAEAVVLSMHVQPTKVIWSSILHGCEMHGDVRLAERINRTLSELSAPSSTFCVLLSNIYAGHGIWQKAVKAREFMWKNQLRKCRGSSLLLE